MAVSASTTRKALRIKSHSVALIVGLPPDAPRVLSFGRTGPAINFAIHPNPIRSPNWACLLTV